MQKIVNLFSKSNEKYFHSISIGLIFLGLLLRFVVYLQNRSLFLDEANLSIDFVNTSYLDFFKPLDVQVSPPFFSIIEKFFITLFGASELVLRFYPFIASCIGLVLFYQISKLFISVNYRWFPIALVSFGGLFIRYATEVKQYSNDMMVSMALLLFVLKHPPRKFNIRIAMLLSFIGIFFIWLSMSSIFLLAGIGCYYLFELIKNKKEKEIFYLVLCGISWLASFGFYYWLILSVDLKSDYLQDFHTNWFIPLLPSSLEELNLFGEILLSFFRSTIGSTVLALVWGILAIVFGMYTVFKKYFAKGLLFFLPIFFCIIASGLHLYTLIPRLTLFFLPIIILWIGMGTEVVLKKAPSYLKTLLLIPLLVILFNRSVLNYFFERYEIEELKQVMDYLKKNKKEEDIFYVHLHGKPAFNFYNNLHKNPFHFSNPAIFSEWGESPKLLQSRFPSKENKRTWIIFSHASKEEIDKSLNIVKTFGIQKDFYQVTGASCYLFEY